MRYFSDKFSIHPRIGFLLASAIVAAVMSSSTFWIAHHRLESSSANTASMLFFSRSSSKGLGESGPFPSLAVERPFDLSAASLSSEGSLYPPESKPLNPRTESNIITIDRCNGTVAHANLRAGPSQQSDRLGIIARGDQVQLIGTQQGSYHSVSAVYWNSARSSFAQSSPSEGLAQGWIHHCWLNP